MRRLLPFVSAAVFACALLACSPKQRATDALTATQNQACSAAAQAQSAINKAVLEGKVVQQRLQTTLHEARDRAAKVGSGIQKLKQGKQLIEEGIGK